MASTSRNSSFELLRLALMVMIIIHHCIVHGLGLAGLDEANKVEMIIEPSQMPLAVTVNALCICAVNCFILISGYFGIKTTRRKLLSLIAMIAFYTLLLTVIPYALVGNWGAAVRKMLFLSNSPYWFVLNYLFLMVFAPVLNLMFEHMGRRQIRYIIGGMLLISCYFGFAWSHRANLNGYTLMQFIMMYCIGRYIAVEKIALRRSRSIALYLGGSIVCAALVYTFWRLGNDIAAWRMTYYNNPALVASAIGLFLTVKDCRLESAAVNRWAKSAFAIYLIQSAPSVGKVMYHWIQSEYVKIGGGIWLIICVLSILTAIISLLCDRVRIFIFKKIIPNYT